MFEGAAGMAGTIKLTQIAATRSCPLHLNDATAQRKFNDRLLVTLLNAAQFFSDSRCYTPVKHGFARRLGLGQSGLLALFPSAGLANCARGGACDHGSEIGDKQSGPSAVLPRLSYISRRRAPSAVLAHATVSRYANESDRDI
jgi:hypothetical protein